MESAGLGWMEADRNSLESSLVREGEAHSPMSVLHQLEGLRGTWVCTVARSLAALGWAILANPTRLPHPFLCAATAGRRPPAQTLLHDKVTSLERLSVQRGLEGQGGRLLCSSHGRPPVDSQCCLHFWPSRLPSEQDLLWKEQVLCPRLNPPFSGLVIHKCTLVQEGAAPSLPLGDEK